MSTATGMYFMTSNGNNKQELQPKGCSSKVDSETNIILSEDENTTCSVSELDQNVTEPTEKIDKDIQEKFKTNESEDECFEDEESDSKTKTGVENSRKNKRKNFKPRNITEYDGSDEEESPSNNHGNIINKNFTHIESSNDNSELTYNSELNNLLFKKQTFIEHSVEEDHEHFNQQFNDFHNFHNDNNDHNSDDNLDQHHSKQTNIMESIKISDCSKFNKHDKPLDLSDFQCDGKRLWQRSKLSTSTSSSFSNSLFGVSSILNNTKELNVSESIADQTSSKSQLVDESSLNNNNNNNNISTKINISPKGDKYESDSSVLLQCSKRNGHDKAKLMSVNLPEPKMNANNCGVAIDLTLSSSKNESSIKENMYDCFKSYEGSNNNSNQMNLNEFAENTMKELLGLYGINEHFKQGGKTNPEFYKDFNQLEDTSGHGQFLQHSSKMMLPENMARILAVMQETASSSTPSLSLNKQNTSNLPVQKNYTNESTNNLKNIITGFSEDINQQQDSFISYASSSPNPPNSSQHSNLSPLMLSTMNTYVQSQDSNKSSRLSPSKSPLNFFNGNSNGSSSNPISSSSPLPGSNSSTGGGLFSSHKNFKGRVPGGRGLNSFPVIREGLLGKGAGPVDYTRYVRRYSNSSECGNQNCRELNYREHFHCLECGNGSKVFVKKEEMIRHFKWHKKRDESLQHGFMRYSPMDDCSDRFQNCSHNRKQTHYHCLKDGCDKVYISTSDVQMHANYHRKDSAIIQEGFQRFRAAEDCGTEHCTFRHQRTTHFHCRRPSCSYTFKNKADMEKHKSYHIKDEQLNRDGFKKFMKHEACNYSSCRFSRVCNHIHCIREGCNYVLHSTGQLYSHKRKHERRDSELAYRKFKLAQSVMRGVFGADLSASINISDTIVGKSEDDTSSRSSFSENTDIDGEEIFKRYIQPCQCDAKETEHFHCKIDSCLNATLSNFETATEHSKNHELEEKITSLAFFAVDPASFDAQDSTIPCISSKCSYQTREKHYHCLWDGCSETILGSHEPFKRLEHFKTHQNFQKPIEGYQEKNMDRMDGFFKRKRGRPPKDRVIEVSSGANEAIFTSFKLPKPILSGGSIMLGEGAEMTESEGIKDPIGFLSYPEGTSCTDHCCPYYSSSSTPSSACHYHCGHPRCHFSASDVHKLSLHLRDFHSNVDVLEGYEYFDRNSNCKNSSCEFNSASDHFHCTRDNYSFVRYITMITHEGDAHSRESKSSGSSEDESCNIGESKSYIGAVKSTGTFFPTASIKDSEALNDTLNNNVDGGNKMSKKQQSETSDVMDLSGSGGPSFASILSDSKPLITDHSLSRILQLPPVDSSSEIQFGPESACGRPFCKLKRKTHFHCHLCNQAFSEIEKLRPHVLKHSNINCGSKAGDSAESSLTDAENPIKTEPLDSTEESIKNSLPFDFNQRGTGSPNKSSPLLSSASSMPQDNQFAHSPLSNLLGYPGSPSPYLFLQQNPLTSLYAGMMFGGAPPHGFSPSSVLSSTQIPSSAPLSSELPSSFNAPSMLGNNDLGRNLPTTGFKRPPSATSSSPSSPPDVKKARMQMRIMKDEPVPDGYVRFRFNEDCNYPHCGYREHQTHFHCTREDCGYSFCDKTRFVQHTARHERLDTLMGGDFKQFRANIACGRSNCSYVPNTGQNKASHFHCLKCDFVCTDTNKVVAHRRQHQKLDSITAAGFEKFTPSQHCNVEGCIHAQKQTHYHCLKCSYAVLGLSQMSAHKYRHAD